MFLCFPPQKRIIEVRILVWMQRNSGPDKQRKPPPFTIEGDMIPSILAVEEGRGYASSFFFV